MTEFTVKIADELFELTCVQEMTKERFADYLSDEAGGIKLYASRESREAARQRLASNPNRRNTDLSPNFIEFSALHHHIAYKLAEKNILLVHGSVVVADGEAVLFIAPTRTGKSTHTRLWTELLGERAFILNNDKPLIRIENNTATAYATPWGDTPTPKLRFSQLTAMVHLQRGENHITAVEPGKLLLPLLQASLRGRTKEEAAKLLSLQGSLLRCVRTYAMTCQPDSAAAEMAYNTIIKGRTE